MAERTGLPCGCTFVKAGRQWWHVVACPAHELDFGPIPIDLSPSADVPACRDKDPAHAATAPPATPTPPNTRSEEG